MKWIKHTGILFFILLIGPVLAIATGEAELGRDWRTGMRSSSDIAPDPAVSPEAVVQVYAARALNWRGVFGVHTWIATKPKDAQQYTVHQVIGWRKYHNLPVVKSTVDEPDRRWFGSIPTIVADIRGAPAARAIPKILAAVNNYPYQKEYGLWPGPNSNTFIAHVGREVPELELDLPTTAIGKDFLTTDYLFATPPSGSGIQVSLFGLLGVITAPQEGLELNLLGLSFGVDFLRPAIKLPGLGRLGAG